MKGNIEIILQHGWGFDKTCWRGWLPHLKENSDCQISIQMPDRGYFSDVKEVVCFSQADSIKMIVCHSLGLHLLPESVIESADFLVLAGCFTHFHRGTVLDRKRSQKTVALMKSRLQTEPQSLISDFYSNCYEPLLTNQHLLKRDTENLNVARLQNDLELLDKNTFNLNGLKSVRRVLLLHGSEDIIVAPAHAHELNEALPGSSLVLFEGAGHSLPLTHVAPAWISLRNTLRFLLTTNAGKN